MTHSTSVSQRQLKKKQKKTLGLFSKKMDKANEKSLFVCSAKTATTFVETEAWTPSSMG